ncbi:MAG: hypothetical protein WBD91_00240, partial [Acidobacteriaceae bacterium]
GNENGTKRTHIVSPDLRPRLSTKFCGFRSEESRRASEEAVKFAIPHISHLNLTDFQRKSCGRFDTFRAVSPLLPAPMDCAVYWMVCTIAGFEFGSSHRRIRRLAIGFSTTSSLLQDQVGRGQTDELARCDDLGLFPERWKVLLIPRDQVIRPGSIRAFQEPVVIWIAGHFQPPSRNDHAALILNKLQQLQTNPFANPKLRPGKNVCILL